jgi:hypothetical protein
MTCPVPRPVCIFICFRSWQRDRGPLPSTTDFPHPLGAKAKIPGRQPAMLHSQSVKTMEKGRPKRYEAEKNRRSKLAWPTSSL